MASLGVQSAMSMSFLKTGVLDKAPINSGAKTRHEAVANRQLGSLLSFKLAPVDRTAVRNYMLPPQQLATHGTKCAPPESNCVVATHPGTAAVGYTARANTRTLALKASKPRNINLLVLVRRLQGDLLSTARLI